MRVYSIMGKRNRIIGIPVVWWTIQRVAKVVTDFSNDFYTGRRAEIIVALFLYKYFDVESIEFTYVGGVQPGWDLKVKGKVTLCGITVKNPLIEVKIEFGGIESGLTFWEFCQYLKIYWHLSDKVKRRKGVMKKSGIDASESDFYITIMLCPDKLFRMVAMTTGDIRVIVHGTNHPVYEMHWESQAETNEKRNNEYTVARGVVYPIELMLKHPNSELLATWSQKRVHKMFEYINSNFKSLLHGRQRLYDTNYVDGKYKRLPVKPKKTYT